MRQLRPWGWLVFPGPLGCVLTGLQKVHFVDYEQQDTELKGEV